MRKLTLEEKEDLSEWLSQPAFALLALEMEQVCSLIESDVLKSVVSDAKSERQLIHKKCRAEGARHLLKATQSRLENLRKR